MTCEREESGVRRVWTVLVWLTVLGAVVLLWRELPAIRRYLKIARM